MTDPYLIAHKVRGEAAFDIACQMICPECDNDPTCSECDGLGYWWIIPTSGRRAYPYWTQEISGLQCHHYDSVAPVLTDMPEGLPDHYPPRIEPKSPKRSLLAELGLAKPQGHPAIVGKINRRI